MTVWDIAAAMRRRWYLPLIGLMITLLVGYRAYTAQGVYFAQVNVLFVLPQDSGNPNTFRSEPESLIDLAGAVGRAVSPDPFAPQVVSDQVTLAGTGVRQGYSIRLPNQGGQWANNFDRALLDVQATGPDPAAVTATMTQVLGRINAELNSLQDKAGVTAPYRVRTRLSPPIPPIQYGYGSRTRALLMTLVLGSGLSIGLAVMLDGIVLRRRYRVAAAAVPAVPESAGVPAGSRS